MKSRKGRIYMQTVLVCDDDKDIVSALKIYLTSDGYSVICAYNGEEAISFLRGEAEISLVLLDIMMPGLSGIETLVKIREFSNIPVIFTTAKSEDSDIVLGLNLGADDYITKPFNPVELLARVRSQIRRYTSLGSSAGKNTMLKIGEIEIDDTTKTVTVDGEEIMLTPKEYGILMLLASAPGKVFSPAEIYRAVWNDNPCGSEQTVVVHIRHLREKTEINPNNPRYIKVVWGQGYRIDSK